MSTVYHRPADPSGDDSYVLPLFADRCQAMHSYNGAYTSRLFRLLKMSGINFVANPLVNIHLQGRFDTYPKRRGITRVKEMLRYVPPEKHRVRRKSGSRRPVLR